MKGSLRFNQSQLEAEENEQITIEDDHYCSNNQTKETNEAVEEPSVAKEPLPLRKQVKCMRFRKGRSGVLFKALKKADRKDKGLIQGKQAPLNSSPNGLQA